MRKPTQRRLTKRQRKQLRGANYAMEQSLSHGEDITVAGTEYRGANPVFRVGPYGSVTKISGGIPFVRTQPKYQYMP